jgi:hypothetical protein
MSLHSFSRCHWPVARRQDLNNPSTAVSGITKKNACYLVVDRT